MTYLFKAQEIVITKWIFVAHVKEELIFVANIYKYISIKLYQ